MEEKEEKFSLKIIYVPKDVSRQMKQAKPIHGKKEVKEIPQGICRIKPLGT